MTHWFFRLLSGGLAASLACSTAAWCEEGNPKPAAEGKAAAEAKAPPGTKAPSMANGAAEAKAASGARLSIEKDVLDVGDVIRGQVATAVFELRNGGDEVLKILEAKPG